MTIINGIHTAQLKLRPFKTCGGAEFSAACEALGRDDKY